MTEIIWTSAAFLVLEKLPQETAFGIVRLTEYFRQFPEMGSRIIRQKRLSNYRQLIYKRSFRALYRYDENENCIRIVHLHNCRQQIPSERKLSQTLKNEGELPLE